MLVNDWAAGQAKQDLRGRRNKPQMHPWCPPLNLGSTAAERNEQQKEGRRKKTKKCHIIKRVSAPGVKVKGFTYNSYITFLEASICSLVSILSRPDPSMSNPPVFLREVAANRGMIGNWSRPAAFESSAGNAGKQETRLSRTQTVVHLWVLPIPLQARPARQVPPDHQALEHR